MAALGHARQPNVESQPQAKQQAGVGEPRVLLFPAIIEGDEKETHGAMAAGERFPFTRRARFPHLFEIPPAAEFLHLPGTGSAPMVFENGVDQQAGPNDQREDDQQKVVAPALHFRLKPTQDKTECRGKCQ